MPELLGFYKLHYLDTTPLRRPAMKKQEKVICKFDFEGSGVSGESFCVMKTKVADFIYRFILGPGRFAFQEGWDSVHNKQRWWVNAVLVNTKFSLMGKSCKYFRGSMVDCTQFIRRHRSNSSQLRRNGEFLPTTKSSMCSKICDLSTFTSRDDLDIFCIDSILNICIIIIVFSVRRGASIEHSRRFSANFKTERRRRNIQKN